MILVALGLFHIAFGWHGDILIVYGLLSLLLTPMLLMNEVSSKRVYLAAASLFTVIYVVLYASGFEYLGLPVLQIDFQNSSPVYLAKAKLIKYYQWYWRPLLHGNPNAYLYYYKFFLIMSAGFILKRFDLPSLPGNFAPVLGKSLAHVSNAAEERIREHLHEHTEGAGEPWLAEAVKNAQVVSVTTASPPGIQPSPARARLVSRRGVPASAMR